jgi:uncharacterized protein
MSEENVNVVRQAYDLLNRGDIDRLIELCSDDFSLDMSERVFNPATYRGHEGIRRFYRDVEEAWESYTWDVEQARASGDSVVALLHCHGKSRPDAPPVAWRVAWLWTLKNGRATSLRFYRDRAEALEAAGLSE